ncbi:Rne/Rng family ribonuclease [Phycisphaerales bacterium AB-hyl4]|uniref:Ribonuclease G n=1 Tax=Natronomicrosphaera hydrolytica TaxID=3242702 RepID=A0ABV4U0R7_9BACT
MPKTEMLINYVPGEECRIAIVRDGKLEEFYQERASNESHVGSIYKGKVTNVEPSIQAAFVDFGLERNGFLHVSDLHPMFFPGKDREEFEQVGSKTPHRDRPPIQKCLRRGQEILVQVLKEGIGTKGPTLTSYLSIPGRFVVMMPQMQRLGVSRKVEDDDARKEARKLLAELNPPEGFGFIVRTAGIGQTKTDLKRDLAYLVRLWKNIERKQKRIGKTGELYTESDLVIRTIRDVFSTDIDRIVVDDPTAAKRAHDFLTIASPRSRSKCVYYEDHVPLFHRFGIESQIESINAREVPLPSGGSLVFDSAEALVAIDVNSGKSRDARDAESNAFNTNKEAVDEIARQLRLRDLGGVVVLDLIDMRDRNHRRTVEQRFREMIKNDRARTRIGGISQFGLLEMTRQRMRPSLQSSLYNECEHCHGSGHVKSAESVVLDVMRRLALAMQHKNVTRVDLTISPDVAFQLLNRKRTELVALENRHSKAVTVRVGGHSIDYVDATAYDERGGAVDLESLLRPANLSEPTDTTFRELTSDIQVEDLVDDDDVDDDTVDLSDVPDRPAVEAIDAPAQLDASGDGQGDGDGDGEGGGKKRRRRRRRRGGRGRNRSDDDGSTPSTDDREASAQDRAKDTADDTVDDEAPSQPKKRSPKQASRTRSKQTSDTTADEGPTDKAAPQTEEADGNANANAGEGTGEGEGEGAGTGKKRRRRRGGRSRRRGKQSAEANGDGQPSDGNRADGNQADGNRADGKQADGNQAQSKPADDKSTDSKPSGGNQGNADRPKPAATPTVGSGYSNKIIESRASENA